MSDALAQAISDQSMLLGAHVERVAELAGVTAEALRQPSREVARVRAAARLHYIGKTAVPASVLDKPGPLDQDEWDLIRRHPVIGERIVAAIPSLTEPRL